MFRDCYFKYAGIHSDTYNLAMEYVDDSYDEFDTGGKYEVITDTLPQCTDTLLYGLKYAENPLEFSVEIINPDGAIPFNQMIEIKNWLFGQDGWKKLELFDSDYRGYYLKCLLIPEQDIVDASGYRGIRCTVKNMSAFWYGNDIEYTYTKEQLQSLYDEEQEWSVLNIDVNTISPTPIMPRVEISLSEVSGVIPVLENTTTQTYVSCCVDSTWSGCIWGFDSKYFSVTKNGEPSLSGAYTNGDALYLTKGKNILTIDEIDEINYVKISYTPIYRLGGF